MSSKSKELREQMERIWRFNTCTNPSHFNRWSFCFYDGSGNPALGALKGRRASEKNPNKLGKLSWRPNNAKAILWMEKQR